MINKKATAALFILLLCSTAACTRENTEQEAPLSYEEETEVSEEKPEAEGAAIKETEENTDIIKEETGQKEVEEMEETKPEYTYRGDAVLTEENFVKTMETLLCIKNKSQLYKLEELPLTEEFFNECIETAPYIRFIDKVNKFEVTFWAMSEDGKWVCLCEFDKSESWEHNAKKDCYYIELDLENDQIASMEIMLVQKDKKY